MYVEDHFVWGPKGSGKSQLGLHLMRHHPGGVLWWDPNDDQAVPPWAVEAWPDSSGQALRRALRARQKIVLHAGPGEPKVLRRQVALLCRICAECRASLRLDECHLVLPQGSPEPAVLDFLRRSRHLGGDVGAMSTNPHHVDKSLMYVGGTLYAFESPGIEPWLRHYGHDPAAVLSRLAFGGEHAFVRLRGAAVDGPFRLRPDQLS